MKHSEDSSIPPWRGLMGALVAGALLRLLWIALCPNEPISDATVYHVGAINIAEGLGFAFVDGSPNGFWPPGYSALLSLPYSLFGSGRWVGALTNLALGLALIAAAHRLTSRLHGERAAAAVAWIVALYPTFILYTTILASENLFLPLTVILVERSLAAFDEETLGAWTLVTGALLGFAILVRPTALALPAVIVVVGLVRRKSFPNIALRTGVIVAIAVLCCVPWGMRNERSFGEFTLSSFNGGPVLWMGNHDGEPTTNIPERFQSMDVVERHHAMKAEATSFIRENPRLFVARSIRRTVTALRSETIGAAWNRPGIESRFGAHATTLLKALTSAFYYALLVVTLLGTWRWLGSRRWLDGALVCWAAIAVSALPFILFDSQNRYHLPLIPFAMVIAATYLARPRTELEAGPRIEKGNGGGLRPRRVA